MMSTEWYYPPDIGVAPLEPPAEIPPNDLLGDTSGKRERRGNCWWGARRRYKIDRKLQLEYARRNPSNRVAKFVC